MYSGKTAVKALAGDIINEIQKMTKNKTASDYLVLSYLTSTAPSLHNASGRNPLLLLFDDSNRSPDVSISDEAFIVSCIMVIAP